MKLFLRQSLAVFLLLLMAVIKNTKLFSTMTGVPDVVAAIRFPVSPDARRILLYPRTARQEMPAAGLVK